ncbi:MAG: formate dehydrogenase [Deltaproteobacteria bacterium HGW-Deltaproteobacteria-6]|jgi:formate dehydrogenase major subunit|nr:MAG: formate dehydrogenase [Deltaproteobacteria bacterium HGW-Deltaproteobacteria-6]
MKSSNKKRFERVSSEPASPDGINRRTFLIRGGVALGSGALISLLPLACMRQATDEEKRNFPKPDEQTQYRRTICTHCSVGCGIIAEVQNGVWTGQEPDYESPLNLGAHCAKGAAARGHGFGHKRIKYPMKLVNGVWTRLSWEQAINEIGDKLLKIRRESGPDALFFCGSSKASNEGAYLQGKFAAFWGTNNVDNQARICHSTTVDGVANTWGYGAMTNSYNDMRNSKAMLFLGSNAAEAHPVAMQHVLRAKEAGAKMIVVDPRFTRTAAHADIYARIRSGTDIPFIYGLLWHVFKNGWEDKEFIAQRVYAMDDIRKEVQKWPPQEVENVTGIPEKQVFEIAQTMAQNRPGTIVWCMGITQHHMGSHTVRLFSIFQLALGNIGMSGGGANIFRGHDNVQGATDVGPNCHTLSCYYGLAEGSWQHWARVWGVDYEWIKSRFDMTRQYDAGGGKMAYTMNIPGIPVSRWIDGVMEAKDNLSQKDNLRAVIFQGHAANSQTRGVEMKKALEKLDMVVISDPYPTHMSVMSDRKNDTYLLPTSTQYESAGSATASNRSLQWRDRIIEPLYESLPDHVILYKLARKLGFADQMFKNIKVVNDEPVIEDVLREINRGAWTIGYTGQSPERLKMHAKYRGTFNTLTLKADAGPCKGDYYGLPWPCWGKPEMKHPGTPILYDPSKPVAEGGSVFRAAWGTDYNGQNLLASGAYAKGSDIKDGYPEFTADILKKLGWWNDLTEAEKKEAEGKNWKTDLSGGIQRVAIKHGCVPFGNGRARCNVWTYPDPIPVHREPLYTPRFDLAKKYPTYADRKAFFRLPTRYASIQSVNHSIKYPLIFTSGRLTEFEGGGEEQRSEPWLAKLQPEMFAEINPKDAADAHITNWQYIWLEGAEGGRIKVRAMITKRVGPGTVWTPFHFGGWFQGKDLYDRYPEGLAPYVRGESCNTATTYGYDSVTQMQETKATLCRITPA